MAEISKTPKKGLSLPEHYDPSVEKLRENMALIDSLLQEANPNDLSSISDGESNINTLTTTGRYLVKSNAIGCPASGYAGIVDVFKVGTYILQEWRSINSPNYEFRRYSTKSGSSWNKWIKCWNANNDGSGSGLDSDTLDGIQSSSFYRKDYVSSDFNSALNEGKYRINSSNNAPSTNCTDWVCLVYHLSGGTSELYQIAMEECYYPNTSISGSTTIQYTLNVPRVFVRRNLGSTWYSWQLLWHSGNDGSGSGLNADKLDDKHASDFVPCVKSTTSTNIDSITSEGMYEYTNITSTKGLPTFTGDGATYGLIVKSVKGDSNFNCCFQILLKDSCSYIYMRYYHGGSWGSWENLNPTPSQLLTKIKTVDGSGSGLDADTLDGKDSSYFSPLNEISISSMSDLDTIIAPDDSTETYRVEYIENSEDGRSTTHHAFMLITSTTTDSSPVGLFWKYVQTIINKNGSIITRYKNFDGVYGFDEVAWENWSTVTTNSNLNYYIKQVDGTGSGIDADLLDGAEGSAYLKVASLLTELKNVDGSGSGLDADLIDSLHGYQFVKYGYNNGSLITTGNPPSTSTGSSAMYRFLDSNNYIGEGSSVYYGIVQVYYNSSYYMRIAVSMSSGKVYRQTSGTTAWSEITPLIPVVTETPSNPSDGQMWIVL